MKQLIRKYRKYFILLISVIIGLSVWRVGEAFNSTGNEIYGIYDSNVPIQARYFFLQLNIELQHANRILLAEPQHIVLMDASGQLHYYEYTYQTLWRDGNPMVFDVTGFYFEFRDQMKQNIRRFNNAYLDIRTVGYAAHVLNNPHRIAVHARVSLHPSCVTEINQRRMHISMR